MQRIFVLISIAAFALGMSRAGAADWPTFRGPDGRDVSPDTGLKKSWPTAPKQLWVFKDAGMGYSGYSIVGDKLYTMGTKGTAVHMICIKIADGSMVFSVPFSTDDERGYNAGWGNGPRGTPTYAAGKLYGLDPKGVIACTSAVDGKLIWKKDLVAEFEGKGPTWGYAESPMVDGDKVIVSPGGKQSWMVAFNKDTGEVIWKNGEIKLGRAEYSTIVATKINGRQQYVRLFEQDVVSVDAETGKLLWKADFPNGNTAVIPTPIIEGNQVYVAAGYNSGCRCFTVGSNFSINELWSNKNMVNHHGGVIKFGNHLYGFTDGRGLICQDWTTGERIWQHKDREFLAKGAIHIADGMIYALNEQNGAVSLIEATPAGFQSKGSFILEPQSPNRKILGKIWTHPVVLDGKLYLRDQEFLHCYDVKN